MIATPKQHGTFQTHFERLGLATAHARPWLRQLRSNGFGRFTETGFPTTRQEEWRFTNVAPLAKVPFAIAPDVTPCVPPDVVAAFEIDPDFPRLVFVNGRYAPELSGRQRLPESVVVGSLAMALSEGSETAKMHLGRYACVRDSPFTALNTAFIQDGAFVHVPPGATIEQPIHLLFVSTTTEDAIVSHPRNLIVAKGDSQATIIESYVGLDGANNFTNAITEIALAENASLDHCKLQQESVGTFHIAATHVHQAADSRFSSHYFSFGGRLVRNEVNPVLDAEGCECRLGGLYVASVRQHTDNRTRIEHKKPHCNSFELYKGILDGHAKGVFNGKIYVYQDAQKTDAKQSNQVLLLSDDAVIDTKPQLEIYADDVKCTHGATVGQLDEQAMFYLRSRGIPHGLARSLLIYAFGNEIVEGLKVEPVRAYLQELLLADRSLPGLSGE